MMDRRRTASKRDDHGVAMIEFAIVASLFIMLLFGVFQFGLGYSANVSVASAARDAVRAASVRQPLPTPPPGVTFTVNAPCAAGDTTSDAKVTATKSVPYLIPFWRSGTWTVSTQGVMRCGG